MENIKHRLERLSSFRTKREDNIPPVDSMAFQMRLLWFPVFGNSADCLNPAERAAVLALDPQDFAAGMAKDLVMEAQALCREVKDGKH